MDKFLVLLFSALKILCIFGLLLGWLFALRYKSKGGGNLLWIIYCISIFMAILMIIFDVQFHSDSINDIFMSDWSLYAKLKGLFEGNSHGMNYKAADTIVRTNGHVIVGMLFCIITICLWKFQLKKKIIDKDLSDDFDKSSK